MKAMILAAGLGTRLAPYTDHTPKPLFTIAGRPLLALTIERLIAIGCSGIIINTHHLHEQIGNFVAGRKFAVPVVVRYEPEILGTGGGIRNIADWWQDDLLLVINADIVTDIPLASAVAAHRAHGQPVTMVLHDYPQFNNVWIDAADRIVAFQTQPPEGRDLHCLAFTGIHVLDRRVLAFIAPEGFTDIISAYRRLLAAGLSIKAHVCRRHYWRDIGTPASYQAAVFEQMAPQAFQSAFGRIAATPIERIPLHGDGSDRRWFRLQQNRCSLVMVDHGLRPSPARQEVDAYVAIGRHLQRAGYAVPRIHAFDTFAGLVFLEDLGDQHLQQLVRKLDTERTERLYRKVIDRWMAMALGGATGFDVAWTYQSTHYDRELVLTREARYFCEAFVEDYLGRPTPYAELAEEFGTLADTTVACGVPGFLHRDMQSRNIMVQGERICFIDFQGGRLGPIQYDLASLLIDPYVTLADELQSALYAYAAAKARRAGIDTAKFLAGYQLCAVTRNLQILGAFAFLSHIKKKHSFAAYIPTALKSLQSNIDRISSIQLPQLRRLCTDIFQQTSSINATEADPHATH